MARCLQYVTNQATRIIVKAAGELAVESAIVDDVVVPLGIAPADDAADEDGPSIQEEENEIDIEEYIPRVGSDRVWHLSEIDLGTPLPAINTSMVYEAELDLVFRMDCRRLRRPRDRRRWLAIPSVLGRSPGSARRAIIEGKCVTVLAIYIELT